MPAYRRPEVGRYLGVSVDAMTLFGVGLIAGGVGLLGYAYVGSRARKRADRQVDRQAAEAADQQVDRLARRRGGQPVRDWSAIDQARPADAEQHRGLDRLRGLPFIRRSALLDETVPVVAPTRPRSEPVVAPPLPPPAWPIPDPIDDTVPINRIGTAPIDRDDTVPITYATPVPVRVD
jgi:hypothetical protein